MRQAAIGILIALLVPVNALAAAPKPQKNKPRHLHDKVLPPSAPLAAPPVQPEEAEEAERAAEAPPAVVRGQPLMAPPPAAEPIAPSAEPPQPLEAQPTPPVIISRGDGTVGGSTRVLANAVREAYLRRGAGMAFHRVAVPYFTEVGSDVSNHHLGKVVTELMAVEISKQPPFTVVERDHLDQLMKEYRLADLGVVDKDSAAQFGKMLGAQSVLSGTIAEAGPLYIVTVRMVDVETAQVLVAGSTEVQRAGLVALSADAVELRSKPRALAAALLPGGGQFYNREPVKGAVFLGLGVASAGTAAGFLIAANSALTIYKENTAAGVPYRNVANTRITVANYALITLGVVWVVGMVDAWINGTDATSVNLPETAIH